MEAGYSLTELVIIFLISVCFLSVIISNWKIYQKAGFGGWESIIPIYGYFIFLKIIGKPWYWILFLFVPALDYIIIAAGISLLSDRFGKGVVFTRGMVILPFVYYPILAFGSAQYKPLEEANPPEEPLTGEIE